MATMAVALDRNLFLAYYSSISVIEYKQLYASELSELMVCNEIKTKPVVIGHV